MKFISLTQLESGTMCYLNPEEIQLIKAGAKTKPADEVIIGEDNFIRFGMVTLKNGTALAVRETPDEIVLRVNGQSPNPGPSGPKGL
jgi:uncharacterized protein YlzI (FlbEa/FlbD family)